MCEHNNDCYTSCQYDICPSLFEKELYDLIDICVMGCGETSNLVLTNSNENEYTCRRCLDN